ncbi:MAG: dihydropteroate synthase [Synergistaceae bacterium]|nr:dihydropteroate synthase [Synergistaceae bacterium]
MDCWGLKDLREGLSRTFTNITLHSWQINLSGGRKLILDNDNTKLTAIINLTPDSFYKGSRINESQIINTAQKFLSEGAYILDLGAESTRPGASMLDAKEEIARLIPALKLLRRELGDAIISVDTYKSQTARAAIDGGADIINDISGFSLDNDMLKTIAGLNVPYILSHIEGSPASMKDFEGHEDIINTLQVYFTDKINALDNAGLKRENIILDPGLGFAKSGHDNFMIIKQIESLKAFGLPVMLGHSRKRFTGDKNELAGTLAVSALLAGRVSLLRVHDVRENLLALSVSKGIRESGF